MIRGRKQCIGTEQAMKVFEELMMKELKNGAEFFDGEPVALYEGKFSGAFLISESNGAPMSNGDLVTFIVTARVDTPKFSYVRKTGELKRSNAMRVQDVIPVDADKATFLYDSLGVSVNGVNDGLIETVSGSDPVDVNAVDQIDPSFEDSFFGSEMVDAQ